MPPSYVVLGKIVKVHGIKGEVQVYPYTEDVEAFTYYDPVYLKAPDGRVTQTRVLKAREKKEKKILLALEGVKNRSQAESLVGNEICVPKECLPDLPDGEYYWHDLIGMEVRTVDGEDIGQVSRIMSTGAHDILVIEGRKGEVLIPAVAEMIKEIDTSARLILVDPVPGLLDVNAL